MICDGGMDGVNQRTGVKSWPSNAITHVVVDVANNNISDAIITMIH
jgi:hypothetical protein